MDPVREKINHLVGQGLLTPAQANGLLESAGLALALPRARPKRSLFHTVWLAVVFLVLTGMYSYLAARAPSEPLQQTILKTGLFNESFPDLQEGQIHYQIPLEETPDAFQQEFESQWNSCRVEISTYIHKMALGGAFKIRQLRFEFEMSRQDRVMRVLIRDEAGRALHIDNSLARLFAGWRFNSLTQQRRLVVKVPIVA